MHDRPVFYTISTLIAKKLAGELTAAEQAELDQWIDASPQNKRTYELACDPVYKTERDALVKSIDVEAGLENVNRILSERSNNKHTRRLWIRAAAAVVFLSGAAAIFLWNKGNRPSGYITQVRASQIVSGSSQATVKLSDGRTIVLGSADSQNKAFDEDGAALLNNDGALTYQAEHDAAGDLMYNEISIPRGGEYKLTLADGSKVWLNSETQLRYPVNFPAGERVVELTGEAFFEVSPDKTRPFIVRVAGKGDVKVYGTQFNVNAYGDSETVVATLNEGSVSVQRGPDQEVMLTPEQQASWTAQSPVRVTAVDASQFSAWKDGMLVFDNMSLYDISKLLSRWYNVQIEFEDESLKTYRFTADIRRYGTFADVLHVFEKTQVLSFEIHDTHIRVRKKKSK